MSSRKIIRSVTTENNISTFRTMTKSYLLSNDMMMFNRLRMCDTYLLAVIERLSSESILTSIISWSLKLRWRSIFRISVMRLSYEIFDKSSDKVVVDTRSYVSQIHDKMTKSDSPARTTKYFFYFSVLYFVIQDLDNANYWRWCTYQSILSSLYMFASPFSFLRIWVMMQFA